MKISPTPTGSLPSSGSKRWPDLQELLAVVPLVEGLGFVKSFVALEPDQFAAGRAREGLCQFGLADTSRAFDQHRLAKPLGKECDQGGRVVCQVCGVAKGIRDRFRTLGRGVRGCCHALDNTTTGPASAR